MTGLSMYSQISKLFLRKKLKILQRENQRKNGQKMGKRKGRSGICGCSLSFLYRLVTLFMIFLVAMCYKIMIKLDEYDVRQKMIGERRIRNF